MHAELLSCPKRVLPTERNILPLTILTLTCSYPTRENSFLRESVRKARVTFDR